MNATSLIKTPSEIVYQNCIVGRAINDMPTKYRKPFLTILNLRWKDGGETDFEVAQRMRLAGIKVSDAAINRHRSNRCTCIMGETNDARN